MAGAIDFLSAGFCIEALSDLMSLAVSTRPVSVKCEFSIEVKAVAHAALFAACGRQSARLKRMGMYQFEALLAPG